MLESHIPNTLIKPIKVICHKLPVKKELTDAVCYNEWNEWILFSNHLFFLSYFFSFYDTLITSFLSHFSSKNEMTQNPWNSSSEKPLIFLWKFSFYLFFSGNSFSISPIEYRSNYINIHEICVFIGHFFSIQNY